MLRYTKTFEKNDILFFQHYPDNFLSKNGFIHSIIPKAQFYGVKYGLRKVGYLGDISGIKSIDEDILINYLSDTGFFYYIYKNENGSRCLIYGKEKSYFDEWFSTDFINRGELLGYPQCCIEKREYFSVGDEKIVSGNFLNNNIFTLNSHNEGLSFFNQNILSHSFTFLLHNPCSFNCKNSIKIGVSLKNIFDEHEPSLSKIFFRKLYKDYLFFDRNNWIALDGILSFGKIFEVNDIFEGLLSKIELKQMFLSAKKVEIQKKQIIFWNEDDSFIIYEGEFCILNFRR